MNKIFVFDTNGLVSAALFSHSTNRIALDKAIDIGELAISDQTFDELIDVIFCKKFDRYFTDENERWSLINKVETNAKFFKVISIITDCRDLKDNKFLELAIDSKANCIISGDADLLVLHPYKAIPILNAVDFIDKF
jgi:putative PIN family toxin of toxin-antitoxin system